MEAAALDELGEGLVLPTEEVGVVSGVSGGNSTAGGEMHPAPHALFFLFTSHWTLGKL